MLVELTPARVNYANIQPQGQDLRFVDPDSSMLSTLPHQIVHWNPGGNSYIFVQVPEIRATDSDYIYLYYDNPLAADGQNVDGTWSSQYRAVWTLSETGGIFKDVESASANQWGEWGSPVNLGYPAQVYDPYALGFFGRGFKTQAPVAAYYENEGVRRTYVVYSAGTVSTPVPRPTSCADDNTERDMDPLPLPTVCATPWYDTSDLDPFITYYDHVYKTWATPVKLGDAWYPPDTHFYPVVVISRNPQTSVDEIHVFFGGHGWYEVNGTPVPHNIRHYWREVPNIDGPWEFREIPQAAYNTYPAAFKDAANNLYVIFRYSSPPVANSTPTPTPTATPDHACEPPFFFHEPEKYIFSSDGGRNWSQPQTLIEPERRPDLWGTIYVKATHYEPETATRPEGIAFLFGNHFSHSCRAKDEYYVFFAFADKGTYRARWLHKPDGTPFNFVPVTRTMFEACSICRVFTEGDPTWGTPGYFNRTVIVSDVQGRPNVFHAKNSSGPGTWKLWWSRYEPDGWVTLEVLPGVLGVPGDPKTDAAPYDARRLPDGSIELYIVKALFVSPHWMKLVYDGSGWRQEELLFGPGENPGLGWFTFVTNASPDGSFDAVFMENYGGYMHYPSRLSKLYGWGASAGIVKPSDRAFVTPVATLTPATPVPGGQAIHFEPTAQPNATRQDDNIRVVHSSSFTFAQNMAVELLVNVDMLHTDRSRQYILNKSSEEFNGAGFGLLFDHPGNLNRYGLSWYIVGREYPGGPSGVWWVHHPQSLTPRTWYYVVAGLDRQAAFERLYVNATPAQIQVGSQFEPSWGTHDLRLGGPLKILGEGTPRPGDCCALEGMLGGYVAVLDQMPSTAYILASQKNLLEGTFTEFGPIETVPGG